MVAILKKQAAMVEALLEAHVDPSTRDSYGNSALTYSLKNGDDELSARLVSLDDFDLRCETKWPFADAFAGLAPTAKARQMPLPLGSAREELVFTACRCGLPMTATVLLSKGATINGIDQDGRTALHYAYDLDPNDYGTKRSALLQTLIDNGADECAPDKFGNLPERGVCLPVLDEEASASCKAKLSNFARFKVGLLVRGLLQW